MKIIDLIGLGTYKLKGQECYDVVLNALQLGYRTIDTARCYNNEVQVGNAIIESKVPRSELFITSKIAPTEHGEDSAYMCVLDSLENLQLTYLDLMLIHWPGASKRPPTSSEHLDIRRSTWRGLIRAKNEGLVTHIGVSNFTPQHLEDFIQVFGDDDKPYLNQVELHPLCTQMDTRSICTLHDIKVQAYTSLGQGSELLHQHPIIISLMDKYQMTSSDILLLWAIQQHIYVIPKTTNIHHLKANIELLSLCSHTLSQQDTTTTISSNDNNSSNNSNNSNSSNNNDYTNIHATNKKRALELSDIELLNTMNNDHHFCWNPYTIS